MHWLEQNRTTALVFSGCFLIVFFLLFSGCVTDQTNNMSVKTSIQTTSAMNSPTPLVRYLITIDPIHDFQTDASFTINGSSVLNVTGTTDFPVGTELLLKISDVDEFRTVCQTAVRVVKNASGPNLFSYSFDMEGKPPGRYQVYIRDDTWVSTAISEFKIASELPYSAGIRLDPMGTIEIGKDLPISGTTDMPPGSEIKINTGIFLHSCYPDRIPDKEGERTLCGGSCQDTGFSQQTVRVAAGTGNVNSWNTTIRINDWCPTEAYRVGVKAVNYTNVAPAWTLITL